MPGNEWREWRDLIGSFMLKFAEAEFLIYRALIDHSHHDAKSLRGLTFSKKLNILDNNIHDMVLSVNEKARAHAILAELSKLAPKRNLIVHNPLRLSLESILEETNALAIRTFREGEKTLTKEETAHLLQTLEELESELYLLLSKAIFQTS